MKFLHTMIRVQNLEKSIEFFQLLGLKEVRRKEFEQARFSLVFMATDHGEPEVELTYNWDHESPYSNGKNFGHLAFAVDDIYELCQKLQDNGVEILRPPRDGHMAFIRSPDLISIELLQKGVALAAKEPWVSMANKGDW